MRNKTHLVITFFFVLIFIPIIEDKFIFVSVALIATLLPDIDTPFSYLGKNKLLRPLQFFSRHRGIFHSFTFLLFILIFLVIFFPFLIFPFFLGYGLHLLLDSFNPSGVRMFYPFKKKYRGKIKTGGKKEFFLFFLFFVIDAFLVVVYILGIV